MKKSVLLTATTASTGNADQLDLGIGATLATFQATGIMSSATGTASIDIEVSNDQVVWLKLGTIALSLTTTASSDGFSSAAPWAYVRAKTTQVTTNGTVTVTMAVAS